MKVGLITSWISHSAGGVYDVVHRTAQSLGTHADMQLSIFGLSDDRFAGTEADWGGADVVALTRRGPRFWGYSPRMVRALLDAKLELLHAHGLWMYYSVACLRWARVTGDPHVLSPHGMLDPWALSNSGWKKRPALWAYEWRHLRGATCLHALCDAEANAMRQLGLRNPICVIPNGLQPPGGFDGGAPPWQGRGSRSDRILLYLGRLHPKKGLASLLHAWRGFSRRADVSGGNWRLVIAGWDQGGHEEQLRQTATTLGIADGVSFVGPVFGRDKQRTLEAASAFILPSVSEGLPMVILEAWSYGLPVLMTSHCNLPVGFAHEAALEIPTDPEGIRAALDALGALSDDRLRQMGQNGRTLCEIHFSQQKSAQSMKAVYQWLLGHGERPSCMMPDMESERSFDQPASPQVPAWRAES